MRAAGVLQGRRLILYDPATRSTRVVVKGLSFANGVALSNDEQTLFVAETGRYRIWKPEFDTKYRIRAVFP